MKIRIEVLDGAREGLSRTYDASRVNVGRHPDADLQFHPDRDRQVSTYHAVLARDEDGWFVRDLDSRNGTLVDGEPAEGDHRLEDGDLIQFGGGGPTIRVELLAADAPAPPPAGPDAQPSPPPTTPLRSTLGQKVLYLRLFALVLAGLLGAVLVLFFVRDSQRVARMAQERAALRQQSDSALSASARTADSLRGRAEGLRDALERTRERLASLREQLAERDATGGTPEEGPSREELRRRLQAATAALRRQQLAAEIDFDGLEAANWAALAQIFVQRADAPVTTATAFAVRSDALLLTSRHVVREDDAGPPRRIAVQFARSEQVWPARVVATSQRADLALLRAENVAGEVPTVRGFNTRPDTLPAGAPVALMGYPLGGPPPGRASSRERAPEPLVTGGLLLEAMQGFARIQGYGQPGGSGSPIFDANGQVVAVLRGGRAEGDGEVLIGVPSTDALRLISSIPGPDAPAP
jgi:S1-C subfamily serine protease